MEAIGVKFRPGHMRSSIAPTQKLSGQNAEALTRDRYVKLGRACILAGLVAGLYSTGPGITLWIALAVVAAVAVLSPKNVQMGAVDWAVLLLSAFEIPSLWFSQYRANSVRAAAAIAIFVLVYYAVRLTIRTPLQVVALSGLLGMGGSWLALSGLSQFDRNVKFLAAAGLTNLVAFRSRLISPARGDREFA